MDTSFMEYFLNNKKCWFDKYHTYDEYIKKNFRYLLDYNYLVKNKPEIKRENVEKMTNFILICDQLSRHIFRYNQKHIQKYDNIALKYSKDIINSDIFDIFNDTQKCFILMPLRHTFDINEYIIVINILKKYIENNNSDILDRFYKATLSKYSILLNYKNRNPIVKNIEYNYKILDETCTFNNNLKELDLNNSIVKVFSEYFKNKNNMFAISLSGGVDSMISCYIMKKIGVDLKAIHINYKNRDTSDDEMNLCIKFCNELNIPIYVREINEIKRSRNKDRDFYEKITKQIRFNFYNIICNDIVLGHNKDDTIENIFSNILKRKNYDNLFGMSKNHNENNITIHRPMLDIYKKDIYKFAQLYNIPYVYDSTPEWSERGKMRDQLIPFLNNFDERIIEGLLHLTEYTKTTSTVYNKSIDELITYHDIYNNANDHIICTISKKILDYDKNTWVQVFNKICRKYNIPYISKRAIFNVYENNNVINKFILNNQVTFDYFNIYIKK